MSFTRRLLPDLLSDAQNDLNGRLPGLDSRLRRSLAGVLAYVQRGGVDALYDYLSYIADQVLPDTADWDQLIRHAVRFGLTPKGAAPSAGTVVLAGADGVDVPVGTVLSRADGALYVTTAAAVSAGGAGVTLSVQAELPGAAGDCVVGVVLTLAQPIEGLSSQGSVQAPGVGGGVDAETIGQLKARLHERTSNPPQGGAKTDYEQWALAQPNVTRAWCMPAWMGAGTVGVTFVMDGRPDPIPTADDVAAMQAALDALRPVTATVFAFAPISNPVDLTIRLNPNTAAVQAAVDAQLAAYFAQAGADGWTGYLSQINQAIGAAAGLIDHTLVNPVANVVVAKGRLPVRGARTWEG